MEIRKTYPTLFLHMSIRSVAFAALTACTVGCGLGASDSWCEPGPWRTEIWSEAPRIEAQLRDGCGFPDTPTDYKIYANGRLVLAYRQDDAIEVSIWDRACLVTAASIDCRDIDYRRW